MSKHARAISLRNTLRNIFLAYPRAIASRNIPAQYPRPAPATARRRRHLRRRQRRRRHLRRRRRRHRRLRRQQQYIIIASFSARNLCKSFARNCFADLFRLYNQREEFRFGRDVLSEDLLCEPCFLSVLFATYSACKHLYDWSSNQVQNCS